MIALSNISKKYGDKTVLNNINLHIIKGEYVAIVGKSGAGKSTLMNIIGTLDTEFEGSYMFNGELLSNKRFNAFRNTNLGFIFQQYNLIPNLTVYENILMPYVFFKGRIDDIYQRTEELLSRFDLLPQKNQIVNTLSGGEQQRVSLIRSILLDPPIIVADEPTGNLDRDNSKIVMYFLKQMNDMGKTIIVVTHDLQFANEAKRKYEIVNGELYDYQ